MAARIICLGQDLRTINSICSREVKSSAMLSTAGRQPSFSREAGDGNTPMETNS